MFATPTNTQAAKEPTLRELADTLAYLLVALHEKLPRVDGNDRAAVNVETGTLAVVTAVTQLNGLGALNRDAGAIPTHAANAGAMHIYNNVIVS